MTGVDADAATEDTEDWVFECVECARQWLNPITLPHKCRCGGTVFVTSRPVLDR